MNASDEAAYRKYKAALEEDLTQNVRPVIFALSMLAEDYKQNSRAIVRSIEDYIKQVKRGTNLNMVFICFLLGTMTFS